MEGVANCVEKLGASLSHHSALGTLGTLGTLGSTNSDDWGPFVAPVSRQIVIHTIGPTRCAAPRRWMCRTLRTTRCACRRSRLPPSRPRSRWVFWVLVTHHCCRLRPWLLTPQASCADPRTAACMAHRGHPSPVRRSALAVAPQRSPPGVQVAVKAAAKRGGGSSGGEERRKGVPWTEVRVPAVQSRRRMGVIVFRQAAVVCSSSAGGIALGERHSGGTRCQLLRPCWPHVGPRSTLPQPAAGRGHKRWQMRGSQWSPSTPAFAAPCRRSTGCLWRGWRSMAKATGGPSAATTCSPARPHRRGMLGCRL